VKAKVLKERVKSFFSTFLHSMHILPLKATWKSWQTEEHFLREFQKRKWNAAAVGSLSGFGGGGVFSKVKRTLVTE